MADAYAHTFWLSVVLVGIAFVPAFLLPWTKPEPPVETDDEAGEDAAAPVLIHA